MSGSPVNVRFPTFAVASLAVVLAFSGSAPAQQSGPFNSLAGGWNGGGAIAIGQNSSERIRCRANYQVGDSGTTVELQLRCASDSYNFDLLGSVRSQSGAVVGRWRESTRGAVGTVTGSVKGDRVDVRVEGQTFSAVLSLVTRGDKQSISIQAPVGAQMSSANITLRRG